MTGKIFLWTPRITSKGKPPLSCESYISQAMNVKDLWGFWDDRDLRWRRTIKF